jgi:hypothetical protein
MGSLPAKIGVRRANRPTLISTIGGPLADAMRARGWLMVLNYIAYNSKILLNN